MGMIGVSDSKKKEVAALEKRQQKQADRARNRYQAVPAVFGQRYKGSSFTTSSATFTLHRPVHLRVMESRYGRDNIPPLPNEIHLHIARYVDRDDLPNYRLASKALAHIGKPELFSMITMRNTTASVSVIKDMLRGTGPNRALSKLVRTLVWDMNSWRVGTDVRDLHEWTRHCNQRAEEVDPDQAALYRELAANREHWEAYLSRLEEEGVAIREICDRFTYGHNKGQPIRFLFPNAQTVHLVQGVYQIKNWHVRLSQEPDMPPVTRPLSEWQGDALSEFTRGPLKLAAFAVASSATKWRLHGFTWEEFTSLCYSTRDQGTPENLISLKIRCCESLSLGFGLYNAHNVFQFLGRWPNLESLEFDQSGRYYSEETSRIVSMRTVQNTFEMARGLATRLGAKEVLVTWPKLRKLCLGYFDSSSTSLLSLVTRHSSTLRDLRLREIWLDDTYTDESSNQQTWQNVFRSIGVATNLDKVVLSDLFCNVSKETDTWDFNDKKLADAMAAWIMSGGKGFFQGSHEGV
ncbi:hypothetical protein OPT61_g6720 [Boeremia exigua]|uniref:Uncharacterized protein n=1 Tax=Boeremia exigua TaxID=749465 RepID=A0ACC2I620_9PLEO|nr:hypothetical protein OPT61_g6720 [Boeremia exigua]